ncbi:MAG: RadC family protein [Candidatus Paracaedibacter sp.]|jgi:DNA repair protein RadC
MATKSSQPQVIEPSYLGHRARLRVRFAQAQGIGLADYELLELLLFLAIPRGDVKPLAKSLLQKFGSFAALLKAEQGLILETPGVGLGVLHVIQLMQAIMGKTLQQEIMSKPILGSWQSVLDYCYATMAHDQRETVRLLFLDRKNKIIADEVQQTGTVDHAPLYPREVVKRALDVGASALIIVHNHPSGDPTPSRGDIEMTLKVQQAANSLGIEVHDHLIIGKGRHSSLKSLGLM